MSKNNIKELSIQVNLNGLSFCILNRSSNSITFLKSETFDKKLTPFDVLNRLKTELSSNTVFSDEFKTVQIIYQNELATLVPKDLYNEAYKADYLKFNSKILSTDFITEDEISINNSVNIYVPYININNYIFETFGEFIYKHSSTIFIDSVLQFLKPKDQPEVYINVDSNTIEMLVTENGQVQLFNIFEYHSKEDFIYYILFVFEQLKLDTETTVVKLCGKIYKDTSLFKLMYTYIRHIEFVSGAYNYEFPENIDRSKLHYYYLILNSF